MSHDTKKIKKTHPFFGMTQTSGDPLHSCLGFLDLSFFLSLVHYILGSLRKI